MRKNGAVQTSELADAVDHSFVDAWRRLAGREQGFQARFGVVEVAATGAPVAAFNPIFVLRELENAGDLAQAVTALQRVGLPFVVYMRADLGDATTSAVSDLQLHQGGLMPGMAMPLPVDAPPSPPALRFTRVADPRSYEDFIAIGAEGFEIPADLLGDLLPPAIFDDPDARAYVAYVDTEPVATSVGIQVGGVLGIYNVATPPTRRRAGYGTAVTWQAIADADAETTSVVLQSSEMGIGVYERMGFRRVVEYLEFESPSSTDRPDQ